MLDGSVPHQRSGRLGAIASSAWLRALLVVVGLLATLGRPARAEDVPRDIVLLLDVSRSMDDGFPHVIAGLEAYLADTRADETLTFATFGDGVNVVARGRPLGPDAQEGLRALLAGLAPTSRFTNITYAVDRALTELIRLGPSDERLREIILLTDGKHNPPPAGAMPVPTFEELREKAGRFADQRWYIRYIVLGGEYDADMTAFARSFAGEATMLEHFRDPRLSADLADTLRAAWLGASVTLEASLGGVLLERAGEKAVVPPANAPVREGDRVLLGPDGYAILRTQGGAQFGLNPATQWVLEQVRWHPASGRVRVRGGVTQGVALATAADVPLVQIGLAGPHGAVHTVEGTIGVQAAADGTTAAAAEAGASTLSYAASDPLQVAAGLSAPDMRPPGLGPTGAPRDPPAQAADPEPLPSAGARRAGAVGQWDAPYPYAEQWTGWFEGWRPALETGAPLAGVPNAIVLAQQPPRLTDVVITGAGTFEGDVISDDNNMIILQMDAGLKYFRRADVEAVQYAAFPLSSATVEEIVGAAEYRREDSADTWRELIVGTKLRPGDAVRTGEQSRVICAVAGQAILSIKANSEVTIEDARRNSTTGDVRVRLSLDTGQLWNDVGHLASKHSRYTVETPQASCGVRGTVFTVLFDEATEEATVATVAGEVQVVTKDQALDEVVVTADRQARVHRVAPPVTERIAAQHVQEWDAQEEEFQQHREVMEIEYPPVQVVPVQASLRPSAVSPQPVGKPVVWHAAYKPHRAALPDAYEYQFSLRGPDTNYRWRVVQPFGPRQTWEWTGQELEGEYLVGVRVRIRGEEDEVIEAATRMRKFELEPRGVNLLVLGIGGAWLLLLGTAIAVQVLAEPHGPQPVLRVIGAPPGMPKAAYPLPPMHGLRFLHEAWIGRGLDCELPLGDDTLAARQCCVRRLRFGPWVRTRLIVGRGAPVYIDGLDLEPAIHRLPHMTRLRMGEYEVRYDAGEPPPRAEVICIDGHIVRGDVRLGALETAPTIVVQARERGVANATVQWAHIQQVRVYRTPAEHARMLGKAGASTVSGPLVRIWFDIDIPMTGRLEYAEDAQEGRFRVFTDETDGLDYLLINAAAARRIRVVEGSARPATFQPRGKTPGARTRLALGGPGPIAVGQREIEESLARLQETQKPRPAAAPSDAAGTDEAERPGEPAPPAPPQTPPQPDKESGPAPKADRYIKRRRKPRI